MHELPLITTIAAASTAAWILGLLAHRVGLSPIVGYLLAGVAIGPYTPGFRGDAHLAHQLAELGIILLMFDVGLHFSLKELLAVKGVAIPGALGQSLIATVAGVVVFAAFGFEPKAGMAVGMAMAVASTVVLMRVLIDAQSLDSPAGHVAVGWLLVEDIFTVVVLVLIPVLGTEPQASSEHAAATSLWTALAMALAKLAFLVGLLLIVGAKVIPWVLMRVARVRSRELFTLTVLVFSIAIAAGSFYAFGASMALGAFLAGMVVAQSPTSHQAAADALPMRDTFAVLFFVSVGMLFDPAFLLEEPLLILAGLGIILVAKPLAALAIVAVLGHSPRTALTVAIGLAQIGEFSFVLSEVAHANGLMPDSGRSMLIAGAIVSITLNPLLFRSLPAIETWIQRRPYLWKLLNSRAERRARGINAHAAEQASTSDTSRRLAIVVGYGPVGRSVDALLRDAGLSTVIVELNLDTVTELVAQGKTAVYGDASRQGILEQAGVERASHLVVTLPQAGERAAVVATARHLNAKLRILVRAHYLAEREELSHVGATAAVFEEGEAAVALARLVLADTGASRETLHHTLRDLRLRLILENVERLDTRAVRGIMIPWTRVSRLASGESLSSVRQRVAERRFSRWPVVDQASGRVRGYLLAKDLIEETAVGGDWSRLIRPLDEIEPDDDVQSTLLAMQRDRASMCVVQENDRPVGIVTLEDILEQVVGRIEDEYPRESAMRLGDLLSAGGMVARLRTTTADEAIAELAAAIDPSRIPPGEDVGQLAIERERKFSTHVGFGVAIPHAACPQLSQPFILFGRSTEGIAFGNDQSDRVYLVFLLVTPADKPAMHLHLLSRLASVVGQETMRERLSHAANLDEAVAILTEAESAALPATT